MRPGVDELLVHQQCWCECLRNTCVVRIFRHRYSCTRPRHGMLAGYARQVMVQIDEVIRRYLEDLTLLDYVRRAIELELPRQTTPDWPPGYLVVIGVPRPDGSAL